ncbi:ubiquitin fusion degradation protein UFD1-domain-containing protein [Irpex lacteus]|nr:ubiquitin fusion degradation protein UFD1-domain-containing protein [Irpex lacteus]
MDFFGGGNPANLFAQLAGGLGGVPEHRHRANPRSYDDYFKAYSMAILPGNERESVSYGGKIIMPPSALARLTQLDLEFPFMFKLSNPSNPAASTHAGVLEFIAEEGVCHLPHWMMQTLRLNEGDPIRVTGTELPKGKFVKLQPQTVHFLEISDPKAVLEQALRSFSALTQGDIIEISYNRIVFGLLIMETQPGGEGINVIDTDLEVDFAPPVGYKEPERPKPPPPTTMASKLGIDLEGSTPGSSRPGSSLAGTFAGTNARGTTVSKDGDKWESFKGKGQSLDGRKTKGKGISHRPAEQVAADSKITRTDHHRVVTNNSLESDTTAPAPLNLPFGQLFFGFNVPAYTPPEAKPDVQSEAKPAAFTGSGNTLLGASSSKGKAKEQPAAPSQPQPSHQWGSSGHTLGSRTTTGSGRIGAGGASVPSTRRAGQKQRSPSPEVIDVDADDDSDNEFNGYDEDDGMFSD